MTKRPSTTRTTKRKKPIDWSAAGRKAWATRQKVAAVQTPPLFDPPPVTPGHKEK